MNKILISTLLFAFLLLFVLSPFASLASLMLVLLVTAFLALLGNIFEAIIGRSNTDSNSFVYADKDFFEQEKLILGKLDQ